MAEQSGYLIIGNGVAGVTAAEVLRAEDSAADITVIADDPYPVYYRPALKDYLGGRVREDKLWARPTAFYQDQRIRFYNEHIVSLSVDQHTVELTTGQRIAYSRLLLAQGARASTLSCPGLNLKGVTTLRTVGDYQFTLGRLPAVRRIVVTGSGTLALETIETLRHRGYAVTHLLRRHTLWSDVLDPTASDLVLQQERRDGVIVREEEEIAEVSGKNGEVSGIVTTKGSHIPCELVVIAIGIDPIIDFAKQAGIVCGRGVKVDETMRTSAADIYAAGDVVETMDGATKHTRVLGQWYPAIVQARAAAYSMLDLLDTARSYRFGAFYNATFLYGLPFAAVGLTRKPKDASDYAEIVADPQPRTYQKVLLHRGVPVGMLALGDRSRVLAFKRALDHHTTLTPVVSRLFAPDFSLSSWLDTQGVPPPILRVSREGAHLVTAVAYQRSTLSGQRLHEHPTLTQAFLVLQVPTGERSPDAPAETQLSQTKVMAIGRNAGAYIPVKHSSVSRRHSEISYANGQYVLRDLGSANGTFINGTQLTPATAQILAANDKIRIGDVMFVFQMRRVREQSLASATLLGATLLEDLDTRIFATLGSFEKPMTLALPVLLADGDLQLPGAAASIPAAIVATFAQDAALAVLTPSVPDVHILQQEKRITLGRDQQNTIPLADSSVSRIHAEVFHAVDGYYIRDLGSSNGVQVNETKIDNPYHLTHGDRIRIGSVTVYFLQQRGVDSATTRIVRNAVDHHCPVCGTPYNLAVHRFCTQCGAPLSTQSV